MMYLKVMDCDLRWDGYASAMIGGLDCLLEVDLVDGFDFGVDLFDDFACFDFCFCFLALMIEL